MNPEDLNSKEDDERVLKEAGATDLIETMRCKNCCNYLHDSLKCKIKEDKKDPTNPDDTCASFEGVDTQSKLKEIYETTKEVLKSFIDTKEENYEILTLWIIGTWLHEFFPTYPYLFLNAMKGSGKTRLMKLIKELSFEGDMLASLSEAVLFRTTGTLCIDEFEGISGKDKNALRELLNTAYKQGGKVKRMRKKKTIDGEQQIVEEFSTFRPIVMANISGMEEVLQDRCITIILEKSNNSKITRKIENFSNNPVIKQLKKLLTEKGIWCRIVSVCRYPEMYIEWNDYVDNYIYTHTYTTTLTTQNNTNQHFFKQIYDTGIDGRNLELTFPLLLIAQEIGVLDLTIKILKEMVESKKEDDIIEGKDVMLLDFISKQSQNEYYKINELVNSFKTFINYEPEDERRHWLTNAWLGKALKRLNLIAKKRRLGIGVEVILNVNKASEKLFIFK